MTVFGCQKNRERFNMDVVVVAAAAAAVAQIRVTDTHMQKRTMCFTAGCLTCNAVETCLEFVFLVIHFFVVITYKITTKFMKYFKIFSNSFNFLKYFFSFLF